MALRLKLHPTHTKNTTKEVQYNVLHFFWARAGLELLYAYMQFYRKFYRFSLLW